MSAATLLKTMRAALAEEREGIQKMDAEAIERANATKERVLRGLHAVSATERRPLLEALDSLQPELRRNLILLTQARACIAGAQQEHRKSTVERSGFGLRTAPAPIDRQKLG